ncbi:hypothetical protein ACPPVU_04450 [Mucilaginibacter sp. McL0603]|uniref:hypothetical protein n=1 Tax=Mucilaginibacter sp. McL0603 TaxID=3415670 RepID=UPI003CFAE4D4
MKKILLFLFMIAVASQLKAQQLTIKPSDSLFFKAPKNMKLQQFNLNDSSLFKNFQNLPKSQQLAALPGFSTAELFYSNMPVVRVSGDIDNMPVAKVEGNIDRMPIKSVKVVPLKNTQPLVTP